ncbi:hypothetical protein, partial [uncultured Dialister sp.]|uniref:hypothetical protein n=1 Tax=uncultured Dialister sp. TaxID=278064 RepID=UPI00266F3DFD
MDPWSLLKSMKKVFVLLYHTDGIKRLRVQRVQRGRFLRWTGLMAGGFLSLTAFQAEGCGGGFAIGHTLSGVRVQRVQKVQRVLRVADCRSAAMLIKSALRELTFCVIWHASHRARWWRQPPKRENTGMVREVYDSLFFPSYLSFP